MSEIVASVLVIGVMAVAIFSLSGDAYWTDFSPGPAFMPYWIAGLGCLVGVLLIVQTVRSKFAMSDETDFSDFGKAGFVMALLCVLVAAMPWIGMLIGSSLLILIVLIGLQRRPVLPSVLSAIVTAAIVYGVFELWLNVDLPRSSLGI
jgi:putative tricarboxylic transport membrane protein